VLNEPSTCVATLVTNINERTNFPVDVPPIVGNDDIEEEVEGELNVGNDDIDMVLLEEVGAVDIDFGISQELTSIGEKTTKPVPKKLTRALQPKPKEHANKTQTKKKVPSDKSTKKTNEIAKKQKRSSSKVLNADDNPFIGKGAAFDLSTTVGKQLIVDLGSKLSYEAVCFLSSTIRPAIFYVPYCEKRTAVKDADIMLCGNTQHWAKVYCH
jgi:hypothetical protein